LAAKVNEGFDDFVKDSVEIVSRAKEKGIELRILGALSSYLHLKEADPNAAQFYQGLGRLGPDVTFTDLDLMGLRKQRGDLMKFLEKDLHLKPDLRFLQVYGNERLLYYKDDKFSIDVFLDKLHYSHDVDFKERLGLDYPTITTTDLVLEKLQIHEINRKDLVDLTVTFLYHPIRDGFSREVVDARYISSILCNDWGFWYDATSNLPKTALMCEALKGEGKLVDDQVATVKSRISELLGHLERTPKSNGWTKRAKVGTSKPWYRDVEEVVR